MAWEEPLAVALALGYVLLTIRERRFAWILAGVSAALYLRIFFNVGLVMEAGLQLFYIAMAAYGFCAWGKDDSDRQLPVQR
ncbi:MAG: nicotinamide mononucleotide transporter family protein, partial [Luminiphilus sp.]|nr:nicotinamide mononucleotide transporter family protein [Luminiphilus sp.]